ncbi:glycosyltransferase family 4 protein [Pseudomonas sp. BN102]|uniref:glycosyltransferase family 4 protein n=1 Tax=Pseudomonas sp. BN102 TaxID=2567886 RepID=UPI002454BE5E|nr:glycosyltransferase family 4 protein [Pseudomonas sp. BN102]MDH4610266.1 glycosyltransferase family 4 protein [Pseudomonas sp. BN102]
MKIIHFINDATPTRGGAQRLLSHLRKEESSAGKESYSFSKQRNDNLKDAMNITGGKLWPLKAISIALTKKPKVIFIHSRLFLPLCPIFRALRIHTVFYAHANYKSKNLLFRAFKANRYIAVSNAVRDNLKNQSVPDKKIDLLLNPIFAQKEIYPDHTTEAVNVSYIGGLYEWKGISELILHLANSKLYVNLTIIGNGPLRKDIEDRIKILPKNIKVQLAGQREAPFLHARNCQINIVPSKEEGFGLVALESIFHGRIVLYSDIPALTEICDSDNFSLPFNLEDESSFTRALNEAIELVKNGIKKEELVRRSQRITKNYGADSFSKKYLSLIDPQSA